MTLGDELRSALNQEADMQITPGPDVERLIIGGRNRRRRRTISRVGGTLAVLLLGGGVYVVALGDHDARGSTGIAHQQTATPAPSEDAAPPVLAGNAGRQDLEPGTYRVMVGSDGQGEPLEADLTLEGDGWWSGNFPVLDDGAAYGGFGVYRPYALSAGSGCVGGSVNGDVADSAQALARQLAELPRSTVLQPVTPSEMLGRSALHLQVRVPQDCTEGEAYYLIAETARGSRGVTYGFAPAPVVVDFWVMQVDGVPVIVDRWHDEGAAAGLVDRISSASESITFVSRS
jgi:hypothetical protein